MEESVDQFKDEIQTRFEQYLQPFMIVAYITDPRFQGEWHEKIASVSRELNLEDMADDWVASLDVDGEMLQSYFKFKSPQKDESFFPAYMFKDRFTTKESNPAQWWKILHEKNTRGGRLSSSFTRTMIKIHSCPASSASLERWFSTVGFIWSKERNRLGSEKAMKLAQVYKNLSSVMKKFHFK